MYDRHLPEPSNQVEINPTRIKLEKIIEMLQGTIQHLQNRIGIEDLTEVEVADLQTVLMNDENEFEDAHAYEHQANEIQNDSGSTIENASDENGNIGPLEEINANEPNDAIQEPCGLKYDSVSGNMGYFVNVCSTNFFSLRKNSIDIFPMLIFQSKTHIIHCWNIIAD